MKQKFIFISACIALIGLTSCDKFLDVSPKSQIPADLHFSRESGYFDQLVGVYTKMCEPAMYGREMTFGLIEVLSQNYDLGPANVYRDAAAYDYTNSTVRPRIDGIWSNTYNCIANLNLMLEYIDKVDPKIFRDNNRNVYKGEALGLRAFLHFDMLRIFAPSHLANPNALAIPYVTVYAPRLTQQSTVSAALDFIIRDLQQAITLLVHDPIYVEGAEWGERNVRKAYFNYYAAVATLARVYLYKGDKVNALRYAEEIIAAPDPANSAFNWTHSSALDAAREGDRERLYTPEHIFQFRVSNMADLINPWFTRHTSATINPNSLCPNDAKEEIIFEYAMGYGNDHRRQNWFKYDGAARYLSKYWQYEGGLYNQRFPIIRMTEAYYIAAEILKDSDKNKAIELLNTVRGIRRLGSFPLPMTLTAEEVQNEIFKEYRKEFLAEGQLFFYYKRLNRPTIEGASVPTDSRVYVLPLPDNEVDFGHRQ